MSSRVVDQVTGITDHPKGNSRFLDLAAGPGFRPGHIKNSFFTSWESGLGDGDMGLLLAVL